MKGEWPSWPQWHGSSSQNRAPNVPRAAVAAIHQKKVIRALRDYDAQGDQQLSFLEGDVFHIVGQENDTDWYEASNPSLPDSRGLVPATHFQAPWEIGGSGGQSQGPPQQGQSDDLGCSGTSDLESLTGGQCTSETTNKGSSAIICGTVMYDFTAERSNELGAKAGERLIVIAQSNPEWFVAKPFKRLGSPGLIPVSFVKIESLASDRAVQQAVQPVSLPTVEDWKKRMADYEESYIALQHRLVLGKRVDHMRAQNDVASRSPLPRSPDALRLSSQPHANTAKIVRCYSVERAYLFVIEVEFEGGGHRKLSRYYEDFYNFHISLLETFPEEAGSTKTQKRTLPCIPRPVNYVTSAIAEARRYHLDIYVKELLKQPLRISRCTLVEWFFAPWAGDHEAGSDAGNERYRLSDISHQPPTDSPTDMAIPTQQPIG